MIVISGLDVGDNNTYIVRNFMANKKPISRVKLPKYKTYEHAIRDLSGRLFPKSYDYYLLAAHNLQLSPDNDTWDNMIFFGDYRGKYNYEEKVFEPVQSLGMGAGSPVEIAYRDALASTYNTLQHIVTGS